MVEAGSGGQLDGEADVGFGIGWGTAPWQAAPLIDADAGNQFIGGVVHGCWGRSWPSSCSWLLCCTRPSCRWWPSGRSWRDNSGAVGALWSWFWFKINKSLPMKLFPNSMCIVSLNWQFCLSADVWNITLCLWCTFSSLKLHWIVDSYFHVLVMIFMHCFPFCTCDFHLNISQIWHTWFLSQMFDSLSNPKLILWPVKATKAKKGHLIFCCLSLGRQNLCGSHSFLKYMHFFAKTKFEFSWVWGGLLYFSMAFLAFKGHFFLLKYWFL